LLLKPQLVGSFWTPKMQLPLSESFGNAQVVKSALIWLIALLEGVPQRDDDAAMVSSLVANSAYQVSPVSQMSKYHQMYSNSRKSLRTTAVPRRL
jgi:hypothetical protein